ncbi:MAG: hypothetical protein RQ722_04590 [Desulfuromonadales bacterium]|nr:hypothetical protein [Desulfuromonadales bacterium]
MYSEKAHRLDTGDSFPKMTLTTTSGDSLALPEALAGHWGILLFYRGDW